MPPPIPGPTGVTGADTSGTEGTGAPRVYNSMLTPILQQMS